MPLTVIDSFTKLSCFIIYPNRATQTVTRVTHCMMSRPTCPRSRPPGRSSRPEVYIVCSGRRTCRPDRAGLRNTQGATWVNHMCISQCKKPGTSASARWEVFITRSHSKAQTVLRPLGMCSCCQSTAARSQIKHRNTCLSDVKRARQSADNRTHIIL